MKAKLLSWLTASLLFSSSAFALVDEPNAPALQLTTGIVSYFGSTGVAVAPHWVLTAKHVGWGGLVYMDGIPYNVDAYYPSTQLDLALLHIVQPLPRWNPIYTGSHLTSGDAIIMGGYGKTRGARLPAGNGWSLASPALRYGRNRILMDSCAAPNYCATWRATFTHPSQTTGIESVLPNEAAGVMNDSGGAMFVAAPDGRLALAGIMTGGQASAALYGGQTSGPYLRSVLAESFINSVAPSLLSPPSPVDFDQNGTVNIDDVFFFLDAWFARHPSADFNGRDGVDASDIFEFIDAYFAAVR